ncbi:MAG TPA: DUF1329 domain-containing protein [Candidatus Binatia bacterium]|nr:DUF1329 domain-containing protein [Candidatus Binatia bacterium]
MKPLALALCLLPLATLAKAPPEEAAKLGAELTPIGAEKAGNKEGTIPAWEGGLAQAQMKRGDNPFAADKPLYTVTAQNAAQYAKVLSEGYRALFATYPDYRMNVYPTRRSASYPQWFYDATKKNAATVDLTDNGFGFCCAAQGYPFPIPKSGTEVIWNHIMRYNTRGWRGYINHAAVQANGGNVIERNYVEVTYIYNNPKTSLADLKNQNVYVLTKTVAPPNKAGDAHLIHVPIDRIKETTGVWLFNPAQGRVRRIGEVGYDNPLFDGLMTHDQMDMFNGPLDRYTVKLVGKQEMLIPYNSYALYSDKVKYKDIVRPGHINQDLARYELHRVWVIEAQVRQGFAHRYRKRTFYLDEDSWLVMLQDIYDERGQFWRTAEAHAINYADLPVVVNGVQVHYDLQSRRYVVTNMTNEEKQMIEHDYDKPPSYFTPQQLQKFAMSH